jgi:hypothetical protein
MNPARGARTGQNSVMDIDAFMRDGYVVVRGAFDQRTARACRDLVWAGLEADGIKRDDCHTWSQPVVRVHCRADGPFDEIAASPKLAAAYDALIGPRRWVRPNVAGAVVPVRFPSEQYPGGVGYHIDGTWRVGNVWRTNLRSTGRGLVAIVLLSDVDPDDAPNRLVLGSHLYVPNVLVRAGEEGMTGRDVAGQVRSSVLCRRSTEATGQAGDVFLCHPFLIHTATWPHRGTEPRMVAQPNIEAPRGFAIDGSDSSPVARAIVHGLRREGEPISARAR